MNFINIKYLAAAIVAVALIVAGCKKDDSKDTCPGITINAKTTTEGEYKPGDSLSIHVTGNKHADGKKIATFKLEYNQDNAPTYTVITNYNRTGLNSDSESFDYVSTLPTKEGSIKYKITIVDKDGCEVTKILAFTIKINTTDKTPYKVDIALTMTPDKQFLSTKRKAAYAAGEATSIGADIDITWLWTSISGNNLVDPVWRGDDNTFGALAVSLPSALATTFRTTNWTKTEFDALDNFSNIKAVFDNGADTEVIDNPNGKRATENAGDYKSGKIIAFKNGAGKHGLIYINTLATSPTTGSNIVIKMEPYN